jgi:hypothetical protein
MQPTDSLPLPSTQSADDMSSPPRKQPQSPLTISELRENIFNRLDTRALFRITATSKSMRDTLQVPSIQRQLWKRPTPVKAGENPHFQPLTHKQTQLLLPNGLTVPEAVRRVHWAHFDDIQTGLPAGPARLAWINAAFALADDIQTLKDAYVSTSPTPPPPATDSPIFDELALRCKHCSEWHQRLHYNGLHNLLTCLIHRYNCITGHGSELAFNFYIGREVNSTPREGESQIHHYHLVDVSRHLAIARELRQAYNVTRQFGLLGDFATAPLCTHLVLDEETNMFGAQPSNFSDPAGVKLGDALREVSRFCRTLIQSRKVDLSQPILLPGLLAGDEQETIRCWYQDAENEMDQLRSGWW